jgi:predicted GIY-YIG superfamily endonuclease
MVGEPEPWFCYMLRCRDGSLYVGMPNDVAARVEKHNRGLGPEFTKKRRPVKVIWSQKFPDRFAAHEREIELKGWRREKKLNLVASLEKNEGQAQMQVNGANPSRELVAPAQGEGE